MVSVDDLIGLSKEVESNLNNKHRYDDLYHENRELYTTLIPVYRRLYQAR